MDRGDLHGAGWRVSKTCEREQEKCYCWGAANEGCREERRGGVGGVKRGHTHADQKTTVLSYAQRTDAAIYLSWEWEGKREDWLLPDVEAALTPRHPSLLSSLSGAAEDCQPVQTKHKIRVLAEQVCLQLCVTCFTTLKSLSRPTCTHSQNFLSCAKTYMLTSRLAGRQAHTHIHSPPPIIICAASSSAHFGASSEGLHFAPQQQQQQQQQQHRTGPEKSSHHQRSVSSCSNWRQALVSCSPHSFSFFFPSECDAVMLTFPFPILSPHSLSPQQRVSVGQPWRTPSPAAMPLSPRCLDARDSSCKPVSFTLSISRPPPQKKNL